MNTNKIIQLGGLVQTKNRDNPNRGRVYDPRGIAPTLNTMGGGGREPLILLKEMKEKETIYRIRKLSPRECFRLQDVDDKDIDKIQAAGISKSQQYKLAGNSITNGVLYYIFENLFIKNEKEDISTTLF